jgi:RNA-directed DNA polymerase
LKVLAVIFKSRAGNGNSGSFNNRASNGNLWSSSESGGNAWNRNVNSGNAQVNRNADDKTNGLSVRCLQDLCGVATSYGVATLCISYLRPTVQVSKCIFKMSSTAIPPLLRDLFLAYYDARKNKRNTKSAIEFELNYEANLFELYNEIVERRYTISPSTYFVVKKPIRREIFAGAFRDRIVHHLLFNYLSPLCERVFINDSYGCRTGKGTSYGIARADHFIRSVSKNYTQDCYLLKLDISGYFMSINRTILHERVLALIDRYRHQLTFNQDLVKWLIKLVIFHDHTKECIRQGDVRDWEGLPRTKSLFHAAPDCGLPIGNLTSQLFGNLYLNDFDHFVANLPGIRYGRYVDDMLLVATDRRLLAKLIVTVRLALRKQGQLALHPKKIYLQHFTKGVDFLGVSIHLYRAYPRHKTKANAYKAVAKWNKLIERQAGQLDERQRQRMLSSVNSYLGGMGNYRTYRLRSKLVSSLSSRFLNIFHINSSYRKLSIC